MKKKNRGLKFASLAFALAIAFMPSMSASAAMRINGGSSQLKRISFNVCDEPEKTSEPEKSVGENADWGTVTAEEVTYCWYK